MLCSKRIYADILAIWYNAVVVKLFGQTDTRK